MKRRAHNLSTQLTAKDGEHTSWLKRLVPALDWLVHYERKNLPGDAFATATAEPRVERVVAYDVLTNFFDINLRQTNALLRAVLKVLPRLGAARIVNWMIARVARKSPVVQWGVQQGMHVTGTSSAFEFLQSTKQFQTADVSASIKQNVLLLAGSEDHYVPIEQWHDQIRMLKNARSITARLFTRSESAQNHCQVDNYGLALRTIVNWLDVMQPGKVDGATYLHFGLRGAERSRPTENSLSAHHS